MIPFVKLEATGNDFIVVDLAPGIALPTESCIRLCDRHRGIGADGILTITQENHHWRMHITNPDGSVPEMCGNGLRCVARHLAESGRIPIDVDVVIATDAGPRTVCVHPSFASVTIDMGKATFASSAQFPRALSRAHLHGFARATTVSMGNPHLVLEVDALPSLAEAARTGALLEMDNLHFPQRTNVEWVVKEGEGDVHVIVWERGAGLTQACGTGACGVVAALVKHGALPHGTTTVHLPGGALRITVTDLEKPVWMEGPVSRVFAGVAAV